MKVTDINVRPIAQSIAQIRAAKEMSSIHSHPRLDTHSLGMAEGLSQQPSRQHM